jgi:beta-lactamase regulating signal transducer with metallopeptidase domain
MIVLSVSIKIAVVLLGALIASIMLRRQTAALRHWVLTTALVCSLCVPVLELALPAWAIPLPAAWSPSASTSLRISSTPLTSNATDGGAASAAATDSRTDRVMPLVAMLVSLWVLGASAAIGTLVIGLRRLRTLARDSEAVTSGPWHEAAAGIARQYGLKRSVRLLFCRHPTMTATWGWRNPKILVPVSARQWTTDRVEAVLRHELAHVVRGDWAIAVGAIVLRAFYWFNPLMWIACRRLRHEAERACDDLVLTSGMSGAEYATHLLAVARESAPPQQRWSPAIAIAHRSMLEGRVRAMLNARVNREPLTASIRAATVAVVALVTLPIAVISVAGQTEPLVQTDVRLSSDSLPVVPGNQRVPLLDTPTARATVAAAQTSTGGTIEGVLYDQFGGLLPGASVRLTQVGAGSSQTASTDRGGAFVFRGLTAADYELVTELPGFIAVKNVVRAEPGTVVRRHITLPIGTIEETVHVTCSITDRATRPSAPTAATTPGTAASKAAPRGTEPKIPATFTGGIGGQIKVPMKVSHTNPICPSGVTTDSAVVRLAGRIGIDGLFTDGREVGGNVDPAYVASALDAVRRWVFTPTLLNGAPIEVNISVTVSYGR